MSVSDYYPYLLTMYTFQPNTLSTLLNKLISYVYKSVEPQNAKFTLEQPLNNHQIIHICLHDSRHFNHNLLGNPIICHANEQTLEMPFQHRTASFWRKTHTIYNWISRHIGVTGMNLLSVLLILHVHQLHHSVIHIIQDKQWRNYGEESVFGPSLISFSPCLVDRYWTRIDCFISIFSALSYPLIVYLAYTLFKSFLPFSALSYS